MALYQREGSPFWWYSVNVRGRRLRGSTGKTSKREAAEVERDEIAKAKASSAQPDRWRVRHMIGEYWATHGKATKNAATLWGQLEALSDGLGPNTYLADIDSPMVLRYIAARRVIKETEEGPVLRSNATINRDLEALRAAMNFAAALHGQKIQKLEWKKLKGKEPKGRVRYLTRSEYDALLAACDDEMRAIVLVAVATGLRRENIRQIDWRQIELENARLNVIVKGGEPHHVKLSPPAVAALSRFNDRTGKVFKLPNWRRRWDAARKAAAIVDFRFHDLRHTFASWARMAGADIAAIKDALAHSDVSMTMRYAHITPDHARTAWDVVGEVISPRLVTRRVTRKRKA